MTDREERQHVIEVLQNMVNWMQEIDDIATPERIHALFFAIASIETDLRYDLLYEETSGQADKPTTKNEAKYCDRNICLKNEYNNVGCEDCEVLKSQELTTKNNLGVDAISRQAVIDELKRYFHDEYHQRTSIQDCRDCFIEDVLKHLPSVTPQLSSALEKNSQKLEKDFGESDCISREQALRELKESAEHHANDSREEVLLRRDRDIIRALPPVTPIRPKGHWIEHEKSISTAFKHLRECSCCKCYFNWLMPRNSFCPNCGARMVEPQESEE